MTEAMERTTSPSVEGEVLRARGLQAAGQHDAALELLRGLMPCYPENRDLRLMEAISLRHLMRIDEALESLSQLEVIAPHYSLMHQERGLCHIARKDAPATIAALLTAVKINPALPHAWRMLEGVYRLTGDGQNAATAAAHVATLRALPAEVLQATALYSDGELDRAEAITRGFLLQSHQAGGGDHPEAMRLLAKIGIAHEVYDDAELLLAGVLAMVPGHRAAAFEYAQTLALRHKYPEAEAALAPLLTADRANADFRVLASTIAVGLGQQERAVALYRDLLADGVTNPADIHLWLGHALKTLGQLPDAIAAYRAACAARPDFGDAWWSLANLKTYRFTDAEVAAMQAAEAAPATAPQDKIHLGFALGKALEDRAEYAASWAHYTAANAQQRSVSRYRPEVIETNAAEQIRVCTPAFFAAREGWGDPARDPIFVLGLPRSGSTLIEQILASHPVVEGTQELPDIQRIVLELQGRDPDLDAPRYPAALADLTRAECAAFGARYLAGTRVHRAAGRPMFIDKMPNNFRHIGLIHLILPNATIIDARRSPLACCVSNLKQLFAQGQEFTYSAPDIARYYRSYLGLMRHWDAALPGKILHVCNEDVVGDLEREVRRILAHCGLEFDPACLDFHKTRRAVRTPSSEQVRQPISRAGLDQWQNFDPWLDDLKIALGDAMENWRA